MGALDLPAVSECGLLSITYLWALLLHGGQRAEEDWLALSVAGRFAPWNDSPSREGLSSLR